MFYGAALFGVIDHGWNGELFLVSENAAKDLMLGVVIALVTLAVWGGMLILTNINPTLASYVKVKT